MALGMGFFGTVRLISSVEIFVLCVDFVPGSPITASGSSIFCQAAGHMLAGIVQQHGALHDS